MHGSNIWSYRDATWSEADLAGFDVEASDGGIGHVDEATSDVEGSYIVVDTGPWIFGKKVMLPAGVIDRVDTSERRIWVSRTKEEIKNSPAFTEGASADESYRDQLSGYYGAGAEAGFGTMGLGLGMPGSGIAGGLAGGVSGTGGMGGTGDEGAGGGASTTQDAWQGDDSASGAGGNRDSEREF